MIEAYQRAMRRQNGGVHEGCRWKVRDGFRNVIWREWFTKLATTLNCG